MSWLFNQDKIENWAYWENLFTSDECNKIIELSNLKNKLDATVSTSNNLNTSIRKNKVVWLNHNDNINWVYEKLAFASLELNSKYFHFDLIGFTEDLQFTEYSELGDKYLSHVDRGFGLNSRKLSIVVQLTDPKKYKGSELKLHFEHEPTIPQKTQGTLIAFPSYTLHEVTPITKGIRHSLVTWINGNPFK